MNRISAIIIDDITQAKKKGVFTKFKNFLKSLCPKQLETIIVVDNGDGFLIDLNKRSYSVKKNLYKNLFVNGYSRLNLSSLIPEDNTYYLMRDYERIVKLFSRLLDQEEDNDLDIFIEHPRRSKKLNYKVQITEGITIFDRFVKIGWNTYMRNFSFARGKDYINVDGQILYIKEDRYGREYLDI